MGLNIGIFGGAFDPPHAAHLALARCAIDQLGLDALRLFPTGQAWHKANALSAAGHRLAMVRLAFGGLEKVVVDARELERPGPTYTLDTLRELRREWPDARLTLLLGADQAAALPTWHGWTDILALATVAVALRADAAGAAKPFDPRSLPGLPASARFETLMLAPMDMSATDIRARVAAGQDITGLVSPAVARYIDQHHLYRNT